ncbi:MAG: hypothetical protein KAR00_02785 [Candidatus Pacebacteria bacterium]|nr:hypothetical protein [Candidatus Paceibacterota bacterium]
MKKVNKFWLVIAFLMILNLNLGNCKAAIPMFDNTEAVQIFRTESGKIPYQVIKRGFQEQIALLGERSIMVLDDWSTIFHLHPKNHNFLTVYGPIKIRVNSSEETIILKGKIEQTIQLHSTITSIQFQASKKVKILLVSRMPNPFVDQFLPVP